VAEILIVEDNQEVAEICSELLILLGHQSQWFLSASEGLKALEKAPKTDLLITDLMMPDINGFEFLKMLQTKYPELKVVIMSGVIDPALQKRAIDLGAKAFLQKPFSFETLKSTIALALTQENCQEN
jgi:DNA-binding NtrC family response regulator